MAERYIESLKGIAGKNVIIKADLNDPEKLVNKSQTLLKKQWNKSKI